MRKKLTNILGPFCFVSEQNYEDDEELNEVALSIIFPWLDLGILRSSTVVLLREDL